MAAPSVVCSLTLKSGENKAFKHMVISAGESKFTHKSLRSAISNIQSDVNAFLTVQVEEEKKQRDLERNSNSVSASISGHKTGDAPVQAEHEDTGSLDLDDEEEDEEDDTSKAATSGCSKTKRGAEIDSHRSSHKKSKTVDS